MSQISISGSAPVNTDNALESFVDVNGDGLPDKIVKGKQVRLNMGYAFAEPIDWGLERIQGGKSRSYSGGIGYDIASSSVSAGIGLVTSESDEEYNLSILTVTVYRIRFIRLVPESVLP